MNISEWLIEAHIRLSDLIAGTAGGVVNAFVFKRSNPWSIMGSVVVGALTAAYFTEPAIKYLARYIDVTAGATGFILGLGGMAICQGILGGFKGWKPNFIGTPKP